MNESERYVKIDLYISYKSDESRLKAKTRVKLLEVVDDNEETRLIEASESGVISSAMVHLTGFRFPEAHDYSPILSVSDAGTFLCIAVPFEAVQSIPRRCAGMLFDLLSYKRKEIENCLNRLAYEVSVSQALFGIRDYVKPTINESTYADQKRGVRGLRF